MEFFGRYIKVTPHSRLVWTNDEGAEGASSRPGIDGVRSRSRRSVQGERAMNAIAQAGFDAALNILDEQAEATFARVSPASPPETRTSRRCSRFPPSMNVKSNDGKVTGWQRAGAEVRTAPSCRNLRTGNS
jgi:hypothetical protein